MQKVVAIVGGGFSGTVLACNLLRRPPPQAASIVLIERAAAIGRGVAYAQSDYPYLLNVPAARLSADSREPLQFLRYAQTRLPGADGEDFLPRALYGDYLQQLLAEAERNAPPHVKLSRMQAEITQVLRRPDTPALELHTADGAALAADVVVLAVGSPAAPVPRWAGQIQHHGAFQQDPRNLPKTLNAGHSVLIVGNGLTMADAALALSGDAKRAPVLHTISRRGLLPQPQTSFRAGAPDAGASGLLAHAHSLRQVFKASRALVRSVERSGGNWREAINAIRSVAPALWRRLPDAERRRFVRHLQPHWDSHRHRMPPQMMTLINELRRNGLLRVNAGRIRNAVADGRRLRVSWSPRGAQAAAVATLTVDLLVNATGPDYSLHRSTDVLLGALRAAGMISADPLGLGVRTDRFSACIERDGNTSGALYYLGPMLRADHWEATGAIELRDHAELLAAHLAAGG